MHSLVAKAESNNTGSMGMVICSPSHRGAVPIPHHQTRRPSVRPACLSCFDPTVSLSDLNRKRLLVPEQTRTTTKSCFSSATKRTMTRLSPSLLVSRSGRHDAGKPLVVLAGWLGCKARNLRRYEEMYQSLGFDTVVHIATPLQVMEACSTLPSPLSPSTSVAGTPAATSALFQGHAIQLGDRSFGIDKLGWTIVQDIHRHQCSSCLFHVFSNGGCFVWERVRNLLLEGQHTNEAGSYNASIHNNRNHRFGSHQNKSQAGRIGGKQGWQPNNRSDMMDTVRASMVGVVFDSAPAWMVPDHLFLPFTYCSWQEQLAVRMWWWTHSSSEITTDRAAHFWDSVANDSWDLPQLYLYSRSDDLTMHDKVTELLTARKKLFCDGNAQQGQCIFSTEWDSSPHCGHLLVHPDEYRESVERFVGVCLRRASQRNGEIPRAKL